MSQTPCRVLLLNMPFSSLSRPAIGISLLKARLAQEGYPCDIAYPSLHFAELIGMDRYGLFDDVLSLALFPGEWLFAQELFGERLESDAFRGGTGGTGIRRAISRRLSGTSQYRGL
jgi:hypothetical protein